MPRTIQVISSAALLATLALAATGCGSATTTGRQTINIPFQSSAITGTKIPAKYTCDGKNVSPPLEWGEVPAGVNELALFALGLTPSPEGKGSTISIEWAVSGLKPSLHRISAGRLPAGTHVGSTTKGPRRYSICPAKGEPAKTYEFAVYAVPPSLKVAAGFKGLQLLGEVASSNSPTVASAGGQFTVTYKRK